MNENVVTALLAPVLVNLVTSIGANLGVQLMSGTRALLEART